jgi:FtsP/CotA-like multicopper oxidase with cupredoxin domain
MAPSTQAPRAGGEPAGHQAAEGFVLTAASDPGTAPAGRGCAGAAPVRSYDVVAINVDITLNRYLDHDPAGRMYVLEQDLARVRTEEERNAAARAGRGEAAVSAGLQDDAIQPLTLRVRQGECLRIRLRDALAGGEPASLHLHGASLRVAGEGGPAIATNPHAMVARGQAVTYEWMVAGDEPEGTHYFHSHGNDREQADHGLFGAVVVEPRGATWLDPLSGAPLRTGWAAVVRPPAGPAFREFALYYHEVGSENYQPVDGAGGLIPQVDPMTHAYRPDGRALNYRSEPFMNRLQLQQRVGGRADESVAYSSYAFGDPATPVMRSYLGDPVKQRVVHGGSEVFHVHHVHGGGTRWRRQPGAEAGAFDSGLDKHPPLRARVSERTDSQSLGPSETFDIADECGSGGCQQSAGDFMFHCHVTHHYFAGMWGIWRVYNTRQDGAASTDSLPALSELPDRAGRVAPAVTSDLLAGRTVSWYGRTATIAASSLAAWVQGQLPPPGIPRGYDAAVLDWSRDGDRYLGEAETDQAWPGYRSAGPGRRPPLLFDPATGKLAYPLLRPHLGRRPPFAPGHGPAPFLDPTPAGADPPPPGADGPGSLCPAGTRLRRLAVNAITVPVPLNRRLNIVDPFGELYVLRDEEDAVRADVRRRVPLAVRANAGEDCVDVLFRSELEDLQGHPFSKVSAHIHFVQFDVQASDGVDTGFNYEQTVRPFRLEGETLTAPAAAGDRSLQLASAARFQPGELLGVGVDQDRSFEAHTIEAVAGDTVLLDTPLQIAHAPGELASTEFVRYRWYPDVQFGTALFHDHVNVIFSGQHGLFGALVSEPPGSSYHDAHTGAEIESGPVADIHSVEPLSVDVTGSFRELVLFIQDDNPLTAAGHSSGSSMNLRVEPIEARSRDPALRFSSIEAGDPETPVVDAYLGDPVALRTLVGASNDVHSLHVDGHWFRVESQSRSSPPVDTVDVGISERYDLVLPRAGGAQGMPGDYLYYNGRSFKLLEGSWGLLRVREGADGHGLRPLPGHEHPPAASASVCPPGAPRRRFAVAAVEAPLPMLEGATGRLYVLESDREAMLSGRRHADPLVLHVGVGDCVEVALRNATSGGAVSFHADMLAGDPHASGGVAAGLDPAQAVAPGTTRTYTYYAHPEIGEATGLVRDWGDVLRNPRLGLYGAIVVGPRGARYTDPATGADVSGSAGWRVDVHPPSGPSYRDVTLLLQDEDAGIGTHRMPYTEHVEGTVGINYRAAPLADRLLRVPDTARVFRSDVHGDPPTPLVEAYAGDPVRLHVLAATSEQAQVFSVEGHRWPVEPGLPGTSRPGSTHLGGLEALTLRLDGGAGGLEQMPGDYLYGDHRGPYQEAGLWGLLRVRPPCPSVSTLRPLSGECSGEAGLGRVVVPGSAAAGLVAVALIIRRRRAARTRS